jgi:hypothetical protein
MSTAMNVIAVAREIAAQHGRDAATVLDRRAQENAVALRKSGVVVDRRKVPKMRLKASQILLVVLVAAATIWVSLSGVSLWLGITLIVIAYSTHEGFDLIGLYVRSHVSQPNLTQKRTKYSGFVESKQQERSKQEPAARITHKVPRRQSVKRPDDTRAT